MSLIRIEEANCSATFLFHALDSICLCIIQDNHPAVGIDALHIVAAMQVHESLMLFSKEAVKPFIRTSIGPLVYSSNFFAVRPRASLVMKMERVARI